jgi:hypothetical protein
MVLSFGLKIAIIWVLILSTSLVILLLTTNLREKNCSNNWQAEGVTSTDCVDNMNNEDECTTPCICNKDNKVICVNKIVDTFDNTFVFMISIILGICVLLILHSGIKGLVRRCRKRTAIIDNNMNTITSLTIKTDHKEITGYEVCSICLESQNETTVSIKTKCGHMFHKKCIGEWIKKNNRNCPNCRRVM